VTDDNKKLFNRFTDEIGKTIGKHQVTYRPSIGRHMQLQEPKARESLLTPAMRRSSSKSSLRSTTSATSPSISSPSAALTPPSLFGPGGEKSTAHEAIPESALSPMPHIKVANAALMERPQFAIDDAQDDDDDSLDEEDGEDDDHVLNEVDAFLEAHDSGLSEADKELAKDVVNASPMG